MEGLKQISVFAENKPGKIERITKVLEEEGINILAINIASSDSFGVIRFLVDKYEQAYRRLKEKGFTVSQNEVLAIGMKDRPGGLHEVVQVLTRHKINVENAYVLVPEARKQAYLIIEVKEVEKAKSLLSKEGLDFFSAGE